MEIDPKRLVLERSAPFDQIADHRPETEHHDCKEVDGSEARLDALPKVELGSYQEQDCVESDSGRVCKQGDQDEPIVEDAYAFAIAAIVVIAEMQVKGLVLGSHYEQGEERRPGEEGDHPDTMGHVLVGLLAGRRFFDELGPLLPTRDQICHEPAIRARVTGRVVLALLLVSRGRLTYRP